ncbi:MAG: hypothetical protein ACE5DX_03670 [Candidatus Dojkabacteria bacterium]
MHKKVLRAEVNTDWAGCKVIIDDEYLSDLEAQATYSFGMVANKLLRGFNGITSTLSLLGIDNAYASAKKYNPDYQVVDTTCLIPLLHQEPMEIRVVSSGQYARNIVNHPWYKMMIQSMERIGVSSDHIYVLGDIAQYLLSVAQGKEASYVYNNTQEIRQQIEEMSAQLGLSTSKGNHYIPIGKVAGKLLWQQLSFFTNAVMGGLSQYADSYKIERLEWDEERGYYVNLYRVTRRRGEADLVELRTNQTEWQPIDGFKLQRFDNITALERIGSNREPFMTANDALHLLVTAQPGEELIRAVQYINERYPTLTVHQAMEVRKKVKRINEALASTNGEERLAAETQFNKAFTSFKRVALRFKLLSVLGEKGITGKSATRLRAAVARNNRYLLKRLSDDLNAIGNLLPIDGTKDKRYIKTWAKCMEAFASGGYWKAYHHMYAMWSEAKASFRAEHPNKKSRWGAIEEVVASVSARNG